MEKVVEDIKYFFNDFHVTISDLQNPTPIFVRDFYIRALLELGVDDVNVRKIQISQGDVDHEEVEIVAELNFITAVKEAFPFSDFGLMDLLLPSSKRTVQLIRKTINFLQFADSRLTSLYQHLEAYQGIKGKLNVLRNQKDILAQNANELALERNDYICEMNELKQRKLDIDIKLQHFSKEIEELASKEASLEELFKKKKMKNESLKQQLEMTDKNIAELKNEVVYPEVDENNLKALQNQLNNLTLKRDETKNNLKSKKNEKVKLEAVLELANDTLFPVCLSLGKEMKNTRDSQQQVANLEKEIKRLKTLKEDLPDKLLGLKEQLTEEEKRKDKQLEEFVRAEADLQKAVDIKQRKYNDEMNSLKTARKEKKMLDDSNKTIEDLKKSAADAKKMFENISSLCCTKENEFDDCMSKLVDELKLKKIEFENLKKGNC